MHMDPLLALVHEVTFPTSPTFHLEGEAYSPLIGWEVSISQGTPASAGTAQIKWKRKPKRRLTLSTFLKGRGVCSASLLLAPIINTWPKYISSNTWKGTVEEGGSTGLKVTGKGTGKGG